MWKNFIQSLSLSYLGWWTLTLHKLIYTVLNRQLKHGLWQAVTRIKRQQRETESREHTGFFSMLGVVPDFLLCCWSQDAGGYRCTHVHTYCTCTSSHIKESAPKVERVARGGGCGQADTSSWVFATVRKCHIIQPDTFIKVRRSFQTVESKGIITSLHHPQTIWFSLYLPFCVFFSIQICPNAPKCVKSYFYHLYL